MELPDLFRAGAEDTLAGSFVPVHRAAEAAKWRR
jgi:hypothetical protein